MPAHIDAAQHFGLSAAIRAGDLDRPGGQHTDPSVDNRTPDDGKHSKNHEEQHDNFIVFKEDSNVHNDNADEY